MSEVTKERNGADHVSIDFTGEAYKTLEQLANRKNKPVGDVVEDAISLLLWYQNVKKDGGEVFVKQSNGETGRLIFEV